MLKRFIDPLKSIKGLDGLSEDTQKRVNSFIRGKAIERIEEKILLSPRDEKSFSEEELQKLIANAEREIYQEYKNGGLKLMMAALGLGYFI